MDNIIKPRKPFVAFLLSLFLSGLGQVYNGQLKKGALLLAVYIGVPIILGLTKSLTHFYGIVALVVISLTIKVYIIVDAVRNAKRQKEYVPKKYNTWLYHTLMAIVILIILRIFSVQTVSGIQTYRIPTTASAPTINKGDWLVADMKAYKRSNLDYGDIVVYESKSGEIFVFRIVGLPNDTLDIVENSVVINGNATVSRKIRECKMDYFTVVEFEETMPSGHKHLVYKAKQNSGKLSNMENIVVPNNSYYVMGDNRDNALDSRYEGAIHRDKILGRVIYSYWGESFDRVNIDFTDK